MLCLPFVEYQWLTLLHFLQKEQLEFGELEWLKDIGLFGEHEVPELSVSPQPSHANMNKSAKFYMPHKKARIDVPDDDEFFTVPDLG